MGSPQDSNSAGPRGVYTYCKRGRPAGGAPSHTYICTQPSHYLAYVTSPPSHGQWKLSSWLEAFLDGSCLQGPLWPLPLWGSSCCSLCHRSLQQHQGSLHTCEGKQCAHMATCSHTPSARGQSRLLYATDVVVGWREPGRCATCLHGVEHLSQKNSGVQAGLTRMCAALFNQRSGGNIDPFSLPGDLSSFPKLPSCQVCIPSFWLQMLKLLLLEHRLFFNLSMHQNHLEGLL